MTPKKANAMKSLIGAGGNREQTVFTPEKILAPVRAVYGGRIKYDCCHGGPGLVWNKAGKDLVDVAKGQGVLAGADVVDMLANPVDHGLAVAVKSLVDAERHTSTEGLSAPWPDGTFGNPEFKNLKEWLAKSLEENSDHIMLVPVRPQRKWWREWASFADIVYLNPFAFEGHVQAFPAPMCLAHRNWCGTGPSLAYRCMLLGLGEPI